MKVFIDESLGIPKEWLKGQNVLIRTSEIKERPNSRRGYRGREKEFPQSKLKCKKK